MIIACARGLWYNSIFVVIISCFMMLGAWILVTTRLRWDYLNEKLGSTKLLTTVVSQQPIIMEIIKVDKNANCLDGSEDFVVDIGVQTQNHNSLISDKFLTPRKSIKELLEICRSRTEIRHKLHKYRCLIFSSLLALIGLVISIRMVRRNLDNWLRPEH